MKAFGIWIAGFVVAFGVYGGATHAARSGDPREVFVVVDSSFQMRPVWNQVPRVLDGLDDERYAEFALATEKGFVHDFDDRLTLGAVDAFAPCDFDNVADYSAADEADEVIFVTSAAGCARDDIPASWQVVELSP